MHSVSRGKLGSLVLLRLPVQREPSGQDEGLQRSSRDRFYEAPFRPKNFRTNFYLCKTDPKIAHENSLNSKWKKLFTLMTLINNKNRKYIEACLQRTLKMPYDTVRPAKLGSILTESHGVIHNGATPYKAKILFQVNRTFISVICKLGQKCFRKIDSRPQRGQPMSRICRDRRKMPSHSM
jgi:hypothetical protein